MVLFEDASEPIQRFDWGVFCVDGVIHGESDEKQWGAGKDICMVGRKVTAWRERRGHRLSLDMVTGVNPPGIEVLIVGTGVYERLRCPDRVRDALLDGGLSDVILCATPEACALYNKFYADGRRVALLAHGTR